MPLSWNEIRHRTVASFEEPVCKLSGDWGHIDLFWPGRLLVEHKSAGADLDKAHAQGMDYIRGLKDSGRDREIPRWLIVSESHIFGIRKQSFQSMVELPRAFAILTGAWHRIARSKN